MVVDGTAKRYSMAPSWWKVKAAKPSAPSAWDAMKMVNKDKLTDTPLKETAPANVEQIDAAIGKLMALKDSIQGSNGAWQLSPKSCSVATGAALRRSQRLLAAASCIMAVSTAIGKRS